MTKSPVLLQARPHKRSTTTTPEPEHELGMPHHHANGDVGASTSHRHTTATGIRHRHEYLSEDDEVDPKHVHRVGKGLAPWRARFLNAGIVVYLVVLGMALAGCAFCSYGAQVAANELAARTSDLQYTRAELKRLKAENSELRVEGEGLKKKVAELEPKAAASASEATSLKRQLEQSQLEGQQYKEELDTCTKKVTYQETALRVLGVQAVARRKRQTAAAADGSSSSLSADGSSQSGGGSSMTTIGSIGGSILGRASSSGGGSSSDDSSQQQQSSGGDDKADEGWGVEDGGRDVAPSPSKTFGEIRQALLGGGEAGSAGHRRGHKRGSGHVGGGHRFSSGR